MPFDNARNINTARHALHRRVAQSLDNLNNACAVRASTAAPVCLELSVWQPPSQRIRPGLRPGPKR